MTEESGGWVDEPQDEVPSDEDWARAIEFQRLRFIRQVVVAALNNGHKNIVLAANEATTAWEMHASPRERGNV